MSTPTSSQPSRGSLDDSEPLDPRVKVELEILNQCASDVNRLEREVDEARTKYQENFSSCSQQLEMLKKKYGDSIKKARPYYELKESAIEAQSEALRSARKFQSANSVYLAAKETISLAELRLMDDKAANLSAAWQEMLNHAVLKVAEAERQKTASEKEHLSRAAAFAKIEQQMSVYEKRQKKSIAKARVYFDTKKELEIKLQQVKQSIQDLQQAMGSAKRRYSGALRRLENISDGIHEKRRDSLVLMYPREPGVGAEEEQWAEQRLPTLSSYDSGDELEFDCEHCDEDDDDDECNDIDSDSVFRARILTTSLDEEDTSFVNPKKGKKKQLKRSQSLPVNAAQLARRQKDAVMPVPLSDRAEACPPDGESVGSSSSVAGSTLSVSSQGNQDSSSQLNLPSSSVQNSNLSSTKDAAPENLLPFVKTTDCEDNEPQNSQTNCADNNTQDHSDEPTCVTTYTPTSDEGNNKQLENNNGGT